MLKKHANAKSVLANHRHQWRRNFWYWCCLYASHSGV